MLIIHLKSDHIINVLNEKRGDINCTLVIEILNDYIYDI